MIEFVKYNESHYGMNLPMASDFGVINHVGGGFAVTINRKDIEINEDGLAEILNKVRELNTNLKGSGG